jgi:hypothetical protein
MFTHLDDPTPLPSASPAYRRRVRERGTALRRRRATLAVGAPLAVAAAAVAAAVLWSLVPGVTSAPAVSPAPSTGEPTGTPSGEPTVAAERAAVSSCGHGVGCPEGGGSFAVVLDSGLRTYAKPSIAFDLPPGLRVAEVSGGGLLVTSAVREDAGLSVVWPVRGRSGGDDAREVATWLAGLPSSQVREPERVAIGGRSGWRVLLAATAPDRTQCLDPTRGLYRGENYLGFDQHGTPCVAWLVQEMDDGEGGIQRTPVGTSRDDAVEITLISNLGVEAPDGADMLAIWRWGSDLGGSPSRQVLESIRISTAS